MHTHDEFESGQANGLRRRMRWALLFGLALWGFAFVFADGYLYGSRSGKLETRIFQLLWAGGTVLWLRRPRTRTAMEIVLLAGGTVLMVLSAMSLSQLRDDQLVFAVISRLFGLFFIIYLLQLRWPAALAAYGIAGATLLVGYAINQVDGVHRIGLASMWVLVPIPILTYGDHRREKRQREAFDLRRELEAANQRLADEAESRTRLYLGLSHDLRTPLSIIRGEVERFRAFPDSRELAASGQRIETQISVAVDLIDQLLELARLDTGHPGRNPSPFRLDQLLSEVAALLHPPLGATITVSATPVVALAEPPHVRRILMNLLGNAVRHVDPMTGRIVVEVQPSADPSVIEVVVRDNGPGIDDALVPLLFQRFATMRAGDSSIHGIGLPLARELARLVGGDLRLASARPAIFVFSLPRAPVDRAPEALTMATPTTPVDGPSPPARPLPSPTFRWPTPSSDRPRVLVVEDHAALRDIVAEQLGSELDVQLAATVGEARTKIAAQRFDVIVADLGLPDGDGLELLKTIGADPMTRPAFIVLSALGDPDTRARTIAAGADDHLVKPYAASELRARVERALRVARERDLALDRQRDEVLSEIHDGVGGVLARAIVMAQAQQRGGPCAELLDELQAARDELRDGLRLLSTDDCEWNSVVANLRFSLASLAEAHGLIFEARCARADLLLPPVIAHTLRRVAIEAMTNVVRHANAKQVRFEIQAQPASLTMSLCDDGRGLDADSHDGFGLGIMRNRAARHGGSVDIRPGDSGSGLCVELQLPLGRPSPTETASAAIGRRP